jgi:hypothetical protein
MDKINTTNTSNIDKEIYNNKKILNKIKKLTKILEKHKIDSDKKDLVIKDYLSELNSNIK